MVVVVEVVVVTVVVVWWGRKRGRKRRKKDGKEKGGGGPAGSQIPTGTKSHHDSEVLRYPILHRKAGSNSMRATKRTDGTHKSVRLCPFTLLGLISYFEFEL